MFQDLDTFLHLHGDGDACPQCAFVVPAYEILYEVDRPKNKTQLVAYTKRLWARQFHRVL